MLLWISTDYKHTKFLPSKCHVICLITLEILNSRTPFLLVHGDNDKLCNPIGSELLYRWVEPDVGCCKDDPSVSGGAGWRTRPWRSSPGRATSSSWSCPTPGTRSSQRYATGLRRGCSRGTSTFRKHLNFYIYFIDRCNKKYFDNNKDLFIIFIAIKVNI